MPSPSADPRAPVLQRALCVLVVLIMALAVLYAAWISIGNFSRIGV
jgi:hypothetical protein